MLFILAAEFRLTRAFSSNLRLSSEVDSLLGRRSTRWLSCDRDTGARTGVNGLDCKISEKVGEALEISDLTSFVVSSRLLAKIEDD
ncbi:hypothetical protein AVEN_78204-1 [Araneus ventricosus]|uniref:Uncharacterized protein n=1 Tax=Araneus ventricosus TaxID=182803 RepID=A0A4Y2R696_ARAVE|nr:hypothetical protein AVEN_78204-1 [Araneus ventricosus]